MSKFLKLNVLHSNGNTVEHYINIDMICSISFDDKSIVIENKTYYLTDNSFAKLIATIE